MKSRALPFPLGFVLFSALALLAVWALPGLWCAGPEATLQAQPSGHLADQDGDLLPDSLERVLGTDPARAACSEGVNDFVRVVTYTEGVTNRVAGPLDHAFRLLLTASSGSHDDHLTKTLYVHLLYRIASGRIEDVADLVLFLDVGGLRIPITQLLVDGFVEMAAETVAGEGLLARITFSISLPPGLESFMPMTFGAYTRVGSLPLSSGGLLAFIGNALVSVLPHPASGSFQFQPLDEGAVAANHFWNSNRICLFDLEVEGSVAGGQICQILRADCVPVERFCCAVDCRQANGALIFVPDGLSLIQGG